MRIATCVIAALAFAGPVSAQPWSTVSCFNTQNFGNLNITVDRTGAAPVVRLEGFAPGGFASSLGVETGDKAVRALVAEFKPEWCNFSASLLGVFHCEVPDWQWPRPTLTAKVLGDDSVTLGTAELAVLDVAIEKTTRTGAGTDGDYTAEYLELSVSGISETDNGARIFHETRYLPSDCRP